MPLQGLKSSGTLVFFAYVESEQNAENSWRILIRWLLKNQIGLILENNEIKGCRKPI